MAFLRQRYPVKTAECVAAEIGVSVETVNQWNQRGSLPSAMALFRMFGVYGPEILATAMGDSAPDWLRRDVIEAELERTEREIAARRARHEELRAQLAR